MLSLFLFGWLLGILIVLLFLQNSAIQPFNHSGTQSLGWLWYDSGITLGSLWDHSGITLGSFGIRDSLVILVSANDIDTSVNVLIPSIVCKVFVAMPCIYMFWLFVCVHVCLYSHYIKPSCQNNTPLYHQGLFYWWSLLPVFCQVHILPLKMIWQRVLQCRVAA